MAFIGCHVTLPGNTKRAIYILHNALELGAKPKEVLEAALQKIQAGKSHHVCTEDKENAPCEDLFGFSILVCKVVLSICYVFKYTFHPLHYVLPNSVVQQHSAGFCQKRPRLPKRKQDIRRVGFSNNHHL